MCGGIGGAEIVDWIHNAPAEKLAPDTIDGGFGEIGMGGYPARKLPARVRIRRDVEARAVEQRRLHGQLRTRMKHFNFTGDVLRAPVHVGWVVEDDRAHFE